MVPMVAICASKNFNDLFDVEPFEDLVELISWWTRGAVNEGIKLNTIRRKDVVRVYKGRHFSLGFFVLALNNT